jgi:hypothetical protein
LPAASRHVKLIDMAIQESAIVATSCATPWQRRRWLFHRRILPIGTV